MRQWISQLNHKPFIAIQRYVRVMKIIFFFHFFVEQMLILFVTRWKLCGVATIVMMMWRHNCCCVPLLNKGKYFAICKMFFWEYILHFSRIIILLRFLYSSKNCCNIVRTQILTNDRSNVLKTLLFMNVFMIQLSMFLQNRRTRD